MVRRPPSRKSPCILSAIAMLAAIGAVTAPICDGQAIAASRQKRVAAQHHHETSARHQPPVSSSQTALQNARNREESLRLESKAEAARLEKARQTNSAAAAQAAQDHARATALSSATVAAAALLQQTESRQQNVQEQADDLRAEQHRTQAGLHADAEALAPLLPVAHRLSLYPMDALLTGTQPTEDVVRGLMVMRGLAGTLETQAKSLRVHEKDLAVLDANLSTKLNELNALGEAQTRQRAELARQANAARDTQIRSNAEARQASVTAAQEAAKQKVLQAELNDVLAVEAAAMAQLQHEAEMAERARKAQEAADARRRAQAVAAARSAAGRQVVHEAPPPVVTPVSGRGGDGIVTGHLLTAWGQPTESGTASGNTYAASPGSGVRAPCGGTVEFAAPFRSYGQMLILNCGRGYRFVLAGLGNLNVTTGQSLAKGSAIGAMPADGGNLLVQVRSGARSVNPRPFL
ncbi:murein hydrolase activator EnvC family protein [Acetobacter conturbans]|nr:peptidoglycan DD-metalloendopeptidase family protein [Acetobacter conturbans]